MSRRRNDAHFSAHALFAALRGSIRLLLAGMGALVLIYLASGITVVGPSEAGLVVRFGVVQKQVHPPGLLLAFPPPIDEVIKVPIKTIQEAPLDLWATAPMENDAALDPTKQRYSLTGDVNIVRASFVLRYQISDPYDYVLSSAERDALRDAIVYECAGQVLASMRVDDALTSRKFEMSQDTLRLAQQKMARLKLGLRLLALDVREINPPRSVVASFQNVVTARLQAKTMIEQANAYAATEIPAAQALAYRQREDAEAYAGQTVAQAQGESAAFLSQLQEYRANPRLVRARLISDMRDIVLPQAKVLSVLPDGTGANTILLAPGTSP